MKSRMYLSLNTGIFEIWYTCGFWCKLIGLSLRKSGLPDCRVMNQYTDSQDTWEKHQLLFDRNQLDALTDVIASPDYFC